MGELTQWNKNPVRVFFHRPDIHVDKKSGGLQREEITRWELNVNLQMTYITIILDICINEIKLKNNLFHISASGPDFCCSKGNREGKMKLLMERKVPRDLGRARHAGYDNTEEVGPTRPSVNCRSTGAYFPY